MSTILEAVRGEMAAVEQEFWERMKPLKELEALLGTIGADSRLGLALQLNEDAPAKEPTESRGDRALAAAKEQREQAAKRAPARQYSDEAIEAAAYEMVKLGHATPNKVVQRLGTKSTSVRRRVEEILARWEREGRIVADDRVRGHASFKQSSATGARTPEVEPDPEPPAPAPTTADAGAAQAEGQAPASDSGASDEVEESEDDFGLLDDDSTEQVVDTIDGYAPARNGRGEQMSPDLRPLADTIIEAATLDAKTTLELGAILQMEDRESLKTIRRVTEKLVRMGELQQRGYGKDSRPRYRATPSLESRGVTVTHADRESPLEAQILACIDQDGGLSVSQLAAKTVRHPRDVAAAVTALIERREVKKTRAHPDAVYERLVPEASWDRGLTV